MKFLILIILLGIIDLDVSACGYRIRHHMARNNQLYAMYDNSSRVMKSFNLTYESPKSPAWYKIHRFISHNLKNKIKRFNK